jgi:DNA-binding transcriptional ArsR family regulator
MPRTLAPLNLSDQALDLVAARFRVLGESSRLKLIHSLQDGEKSVTDLIRATGLAQANASRHLQALTTAGFLARRKEGLKVFYSIADPHTFKLCDLVCGSLQKSLAQHAGSFE